MISAFIDCRAVVAHVQKQRAKDVQPVMSVSAFLLFLVAQFRRTSPDLQAKLKYGDDGKGAQKMALLQVCAGCVHVCSVT